MIMDREYNRESQREADREPLREHTLFHAVVHERLHAIPSRLLVGAKANRLSSLSAH
jgi:hypothetical protein